MKTITLEQIKETKGVASVGLWKEKRYYINSGFKQVTKIWWEKDGLIRIQKNKGTDSNEAVEMIENLIGCNLTECYTKKAEYVIVK